MSDAGSNNVLGNLLGIICIDPCDFWLVVFYQVISTCIDLWLATINKNCSQANTVHEFKLDTVSGDTFNCIPQPSPHSLEGTTCLMSAINTSYGNSFKNFNIHIADVKMSGTYVYSAIYPRPQPPIPSNFQRPTCRCCHEVRHPHCVSDWPKMEA